MLVVAQDFSGLGRGFVVFVDTLEGTLIGILLFIAHAIERFLSQTKSLGLRFSDEVGRRLLSYRSRAGGGGVSRGEGGAVQGLEVLDLVLGEVEDVGVGAPSHPEFVIVG